MQEVVIIIDVCWLKKRKTRGCYSQVSAIVVIIITIIRNIKMIQIVIIAVQRRISALLLLLLIQEVGDVGAVVHTCISAGKTRVHSNRRCGTQVLLLLLLMNDWNIIGIIDIIISHQS